MWSSFYLTTPALERRKAHLFTLQTIIELLRSPQSVWGTDKEMETLTMGAWEDGRGSELALL
jgi:hypothetical protein